MTTIPGIPAPILGSAPRRRRAGHPGFEVPETAEPHAAAAAAPAALAGLLAMQEATGADDADRAARRIAEAALQDLQSLQLTLLRGGSSAAGCLAQPARKAPPAADPRLAAVLLAIQVRAAVERARAGVVRRESDTEKPTSTGC